MKQESFALGFVALFFLWIMIMLRQQLNLMMILTSDLILGFFVMGLTLIAEQVLQLLTYRTWYKRNQVWLNDEDDMYDRYHFPLWFAQTISITSEVMRWLLYVGIALCLLSTPLTTILLSSASSVLVLIFGLIYRKYIDSGRQSKETNARTVLIILFFVYITPIQELIAPWVDKLPKPKANMEEVLVLTDIGIMGEVVYHENKPMKSVFTLSQVDYTESSVRQRVHTQRYTFRSETFLSWYLTSLNQNYQVQDLPKDVNLQGGYLSDDNKSFYVIEGNRLFLISSTKAFEQESDFAGVRNKLLP